MDIMLNTEIMTLYRKVETGEIGTASQLEMTLQDIATRYGLESTGIACAMMLEHCNPIAQQKIKEIGGFNK